MSITLVITIETAEHTFNLGFVFSFFETTLFTHTRNGSNSVSAKEAAYPLNNANS